MGLGVVDSADNPGDRRRAVAEATVHPGSVTHTFHLAFHPAGQVAVGAVVQTLHVVRVDQRRAEGRLGILQTPAAGMVFKEQLTSGLQREELQVPSSFSTGLFQVPRLLTNKSSV